MSESLLKGQSVRSARVTHCSGPLTSHHHSQDDTGITLQPASKLLAQGNAILLQSSSDILMRSDQDMLLSGQVVFFESQVECSCPYFQHLG